MALFGKKKGDAPAKDQESNSKSEAPQNENGSFDFDSIARDLEAQDGPSPFDDLLSKPANLDAFDSSQNNEEELSGSAFDFPDSPLELEDELPPRTSAVVPSNDLDNLDDLFGGTVIQNDEATVPPADSFPDSPVVTPPVVTPSTATVVPSQPEVKAKKPFPLIPALGALAILALAGGAGWYFSQPAEEEPTPIVSTVKSNPEPPTAPAQTTPDAPAAAVEPDAASVAPVKPAAPQAPTTPAKPAAPSATIDDPAVATQLKNLWEQGKYAKARGDYEAARQFWQQALKIKPGHPGFQESIDKLPK